MKSLEERISDDLAIINPTPQRMAAMLHELIKMQVLFGNMLAALPVNLLLTDDMGKVLAATPKILREFLHCRREDVLGEYLSVVMQRVADDNKWVLNMDAAAINGKQWAGITKLPDGEHIGVRVCPLDIEGACMSMVLAEHIGKLDNSFWKQQLLYRSENNQELIKAGILAGGVLHEVKNLIQNISGSVQLIQFSTPKSDSAQKVLEIMECSIEEATMLIEDFMAFGRMDMKFADYSLNDIVLATLRTTGSNCKINGIEVFDELDADMPLIYLDSKRIKEVLVNTMLNSIEAIVQRRKEDSDFFGEINIKTVADKEHKEARIIIEDNGVGLTPEQEKHFFEPLYTTKEGGNGIGTFFNRTIIERHRGSVTANNRPEGGCRVVITLPYENRLIEDSLSLYEDMLNLDE